MKKKRINIALGISILIGISCFLVSLTLPVKYEGSNTTTSYSCHVDVYIGDPDCQALSNYTLYIEILDWDGSTNYSNLDRKQYQYGTNQYSFDVTATYSRIVARIVDTEQDPCYYGFVEDSDWDYGTNCPLQFTLYPCQ